MLSTAFPTFRRRNLENNLVGAAIYYRKIPYESHQQMFHLYSCFVFHWNIQFSKLYDKQFGGYYILFVDISAKLINQRPEKLGLVDSDSRTINVAGHKKKDWRIQMQQVTESSQPKTENQVLSWSEKPRVVLTDIMVNNSTQMYGATFGQKRKPKSHTFLRTV